MEDDFDMMEDDLAKMEDDLQLSWKMTKICHFLYINQGRLNPFKCSEMILNYEEKMIDEVNRMEGDLQTTEDDLQTTEDDPMSN